MMSDEMIETVSKIIFDAMRWAAMHAENGSPPEWKNGNSLAEGEARRAARAAIEATTVKGDGLVERKLRQRAAARLGLKRPTPVHRYDAELDRQAADTITTLKGEIERLRGWVEDGYLEGYSTGRTAGTMTMREEDWARSKARQALGSTDNVG